MTIKIKDSVLHVETKRYKVVARMCKLTEFGKWRVEKGFYSNLYRCFPIVFNIYY